MIINNITPYSEGLQKANNPGALNATSAESKVVSSSGRNSAASIPVSEINNAQLLGISEKINVLQENLDLNLVQYPPFFPIASYQRMDLIGEINNIQEAIDASSLSLEWKQDVSGQKLPDDATDEQIANVLDKVLALRDTLSHEIAAVKNSIQPGSILKLEV